MKYPFFNVLYFQNALYNLILVSYRYISKVYLGKQHCVDLKQSSVYSFLCEKWYLISDWFYAGRTFFITTDVDLEKNMTFKG